MKKQPRPRAGLIRRTPAVLYESPAETRAFLLALAESTTDDALKKETGRFLDFSEKLARDVYRRHGIDPADRYCRDAKRGSDGLPPDLDRDTELAFARDILGRVGGLRFALERDFKGDPGAWVAVASFGLANAVASLQIEFEHGPVYSAGAKTIAGAKIGARGTAEKRHKTIRANHARWEEVDRDLSRALSASARAGIIARQVEGTKFEGSARSIREFLRKKVGKMPATLPIVE